MTRWQLIASDAYRITGRNSPSDSIRLLLTGETFRYNVALRCAQTARSRIGRVLWKLWLRRERVRLGINIPHSTVVGPGLLIGHAGGIVVNAAATIGSNCNISQNVTIGVSRGGERAGVPCIGDRVYIGPGAVLAGSIKVGDDAAIGANAVVTRDVPSGHTAVGVPAKVREGGSWAYVNRVFEPGR